MDETTRLSTLPQPEQLRVVERIFQRLLLAFGNQITAKWEGIDMQFVYKDWAESLADFSLGAIKLAIEKSKAMKHPPNQGEFRELCRDYKPAAPVLQLRRKFTPEELEANRKRLAEIANGLGMKLSRAQAHANMAGSPAP